MGPDRLTYVGVPTAPEWSSKKLSRLDHGSDGKIRPAFRQLTADEISAKKRQTESAALGEMTMTRNQSCDG